MTIVLLLIFLVLLLMGTPIAFVLGITSLIMIVLFSNTSPLMVPEVMYNAMDSYSLMAIPFFMIGAQFMLKGGISRYLIDAANSYVRHLRGGLAIVCVLACMVFAAICGSSAATALAMGVIIIPEMIKRGYPQSFATGVVAASGTMGIMIPPSLAFILYGILTEQSIPRLFLAGMMPGILEGALYIGWISFYSRRKGFRGGERATKKEVITSTTKALPALSLPVLVLGGIYSGIVTVTEAAALFAIAAIIASIFIYRGVRLNEVIRISGESMLSAGMILIILSTAVVFGNWVTEAKIPAHVVDVLSEMNLSPLMFLVFINILILILGAFLEGVSITLILVPVLLPILEHMGIDLIHFAVILTVNMEVAMLTPPVGMNLFVISGASRAPLSVVIRGSLPFVIIGFFQIALVTYFPSISLFLPNLIMPR